MQNRTNNVELEQLAGYYFRGPDEQPLLAEFRTSGPKRDWPQSSTAPDANINDNEETSYQLLRRETRRSNIIVLLLIISGTLWAFLASWFKPWTPLRIFGLILFLSGEGLVYLARLQLGTSFAVAPKARALVTTGLYSKIQNPIYLFAMIAVMGLVLFLDQPLYGLTLLAVVPIQLHRIKMERQILTKHFGEAYLRYRRQTWF